MAVNCDMMLAAPCQCYNWRKFSLSHQIHAEFYVRHQMAGSRHETESVCLCPGLKLDYNVPLRLEAAARDP